MYYVYILSNWNNKLLYIGVTNDLKRRITEHKNKLVEGYTKKYNISKLLYYEEYHDIRNAILREKQLKAIKRLRKEELIAKQNPDFQDLSKYM